jgi:S1-C subfamily serine protease
VSPSVIVDVILLLLLLSALIQGYRSGLVRSVSGIVGALAGGAAALLVVPLVPTWVPAPEWRVPATVAAALLLVLLGLTIGSSIGSGIAHRLRKTAFGVIDRLLGAVATLVATALVLGMLALSIGSLGVPVLSPALGSSAVIRSIDGLTPDPVKSFVAQVRASVLQEGLPRIVDAFTGEDPVLPQFDTNGAPLQAASASVVRITGNAYACGQSQSGSGFVISPQRVVTNAHVVAGVDQPVVETTDGALPGRVVYFDPVDDLAVIAVDDLAAAPLGTAEDLAVGQRAVTEGYPFGGPFDADPAEVLALGPLAIPDIYGANPAPRQVYTLAADVQQGESGGPLLTEDGRVAGVIFAKGTTTANVGYALAMSELAPVAAAAPGLTEPVTAGTCVRG